MLPKERVAAIFEHQPTDKVPLYVGSWSSRAASYVVGREVIVGGGCPQYHESCALWEDEEAHEEFIARIRRDALDIPRAADLDYVRPGYWRLPEKPTKRIDEYTFYFGDESNWRVMRYDPESELYGVVDQSPQPELTIEDIERQVDAMEASEPAPRRPEDYPELVAAIKEIGHERAVQGVAPWCALPYSDRLWLEAIALRPELMKRYVLAAARNTLPVVACMAEIGTPYLHGGGDFAGETGPMYSPQAFHEIMLPGLQMISEECKRYSCYHMFASDGDLWPVADDLFGASGVEGYYEIDLLAGMDLRRLRETYPHLTLLGGIASKTLHIGSVEAVKREALAALEVAKELGSIMVGCSNLIVSMTPPENIEAMLTTLHENRDI